MSSLNHNAHDRRIGLDILRIILCAMVLICHYGNIGYTPYGYIGYPGMMAVTGFFVLSGYLTTLSLKKSASHFDAWAFYRSKMNRLLPTFIICLAFGILTVPILKYLNPDYPLYAHDGTNLTGLIVYYDGPAWFIMKLFLYLVFTPLLFFLSRRKLLFSLLIAGLALYSLFAHMYLKLPFTYATEFHLMAYTSGMLAADVQPLCAGSAKSRRVLTAASLLTIATLLLADISTNCLFFSRIGLPFIANFLLIFIFALLIPLWGSLSCASHNRFSQGLVYAAALTYPIYLLHIPLLQLSLHCSGLWQKTHNIPGHYMAVSVSFVICIGASILLERYCRRWK